VRLLHREGAERTGGLGGAVLAGIQATDAAWVVVMDGDLQHPPEVVPELLHEGEELDIVVASRYCGDGAADRLRSRYRELVSSSASAVARLAFPRRLARVTDPLSGFFAVPVAALDAASQTSDLGNCQAAAGSSWVVAWVGQALAGSKVWPVCRQ
jgi:dolichol-phosphate mannosyltransferase